MPGIIATHRLRLSPFSDRDSEDLFEARGDPIVMAHWDWPADESAGQTRAVAALLLADIGAGSARYWTVRQAQSMQFAGLCDFSEIGDGGADLGFLFARRFWGRGYAREALSAMLEEAPLLGIGCLRARVHEDNLPSRRLLEHLAFVQSEVLPEFEIRPGVRRTCLVFERVLERSV